MNFPGLDPAWSGIHHSAHRIHLIRPWTLAHCRAGLAAGDSVLVVSTTALGDSILCTPLLQALADTLGPQRVGFLVRKPYAALYEGDPRIGRLYTVGGKYRGFCGLKHQLSATIRPPRIALIANGTDPDLIPWLWHCGLRGFLRYRSRWSQWATWFANQEMMRPPGAEDYATGHAIENNLAMASLLGVPAMERQLKTYPPGVPAEPCPPEKRDNTVIIHPGASRLEKRWPLENWTAVLYRLNRDYGCRVLITGNTAEFDDAEKLRRRLMPGVPTENLAGKLSLPELAQRQYHASLFLSGDTGPYHLAVSVGCPTVTLFAPRDRGSSIEACGPHQADPRFHRALQTARFDLKLATIFPELLIEEANSILTALAQARQPADTTSSAAS